MTVVRVAEVDRKSLAVSPPFIVEIVADVERKLLLVNSPLIREIVADVERKLLAVASPERVTMPEKVGLPPTVVRVVEAALNPP